MPKTTKSKATKSKSTKKSATSAKEASLQTTPLSVQQPAAQPRDYISIKVCSLTKLKTLTSSIHLNKELERLCDVTVMDWPYYGKFQATIAPLLNMFRLRKALKSFDILHIQYDIAGYMPFFLPMVWLLSIGAKAKIVLSLHEKYDNVPLARLVIAFHDFWYRLADALLVHTQEHKEFLAKGLHARTHVIPHGVIEAPGVTHEFGSNIILFAGYVNAWKGHDLAVKAMPQVIKEVPDAKLLVLSRSNDIKYEEGVKKMIRDLHLENSVEWNDKRIEEAEMFRFFDTAAISLLPYRRITMSGILSHTLSRGVPSIMSDLPPFIEVTKNKAIYFKNEDVSDLANNLIQLLKDRKTQERMSKDFMALTKEYAWSRMARMTRDVYVDLLQSEWPKLETIKR